MPGNTTITAVATAGGPGAIGIIRVSGPACAEIVRRVAENLPPPRHASLQCLYDETHRQIDRGIVLYFPAPASYTGEDVLEFHVHGGAAILTALAASICAAGAVPARPGEFTERAFLNGKIDLLQAEAVADLISSSSLQGLRAANLAMAGHFSKAIRDISDALREARAGLEASIDFSDEAVMEDLAGPFDAVRRLIRELEMLLASARAGAHLLAGARVVLLGPPNAGKSTLLNALSGQDRAIVSDEPGTTRDVLTAEITLDGMMITMSDTAGLHETAHTIEREGIRRAMQEVQHADLVLALYAATDPRPALSTWLAPEALRTDALVYVRNKIDLTGEAPRLEHHDGIPEVGVSARYLSGLDLLRETIRSKLGRVQEGDNPMLARERHLRALATALEMLDFADLAEFSRDVVESAERLRLAERALGEMTGEFTNEDLLGEIFARFCIGK